MVAGVARCAALAAALSLFVGLLQPLTTATAARADTVRDRQWALRTMHGRQAWHYSRGDGTTVAVLDTGVYPRQADLAGRVTTGPDYTHSGRRPGSRYWGRHGTAMAGLISGHGHGARRHSGVLGVAPHARILSIRVTLEADDPLRPAKGAFEQSRHALANGIKYAVDHGADVISMSLGGGTNFYNGNSVEHDAVAYAQHAGVVLVASAGNDGAKANRQNFPAAYPGVIAVGAVGKHLRRASFSNRRDYVRLTAPGIGVATAGGRYGYASITGTSASTALVAGVVALLRARYEELTPGQVRTALTRSVSTNGAVDARRALFAAAKIRKASRQASASASPSATSGATASPVAHADSADSAPLTYGALGAGVIVLLAVAGGLLIRRRRLGDGAPPVPEPAGPARAADTGLGGGRTTGGPAPQPYLSAPPVAPPAARPAMPFADAHPAAGTETFGAVPAGEHGTAARPPRDDSAHDDSARRDKPDVSGDRESAPPDGSVWDPPKLWQGSGSDTTAPFEAEMRSGGGLLPARDRMAGRGATGWVTAAGWDTSRDDDSTLRDDSWSSDSPVDGDADADRR